MSAIFYKPTATFTFTCLPSLKSPKPFSGSRFPSSKLGYRGEFVSQRALRNAMNGLIPTGAFGSSGGDEGGRAFEQEALAQGSSDFRPNFGASGLESTLNRLSKWLVTALFSAIVLWRHDAEALWAAMGSVINVGLSTILKQILNQERPVSTLRSDPGMPSSHAQSIFFTVIFTVMSMFQWLGASVLSVTLSGLAFAFGSYLSWLRVSQQLHTISQVAVGAMLGSVFSFLWLWLWDAVVLKAFISYLWVRIIVVFGAAGFCLGFLIYTIRHWVIDRR
ncbi:lipid phosphate phosphatase epsilon 2, chloroplastic [Diospyros lotus]|uniref:lipid phosphate phosphatase epsilon 2, chloroplastic n=1 Tax=Diospyros lotus TaxID=55363 RepID=UPI00225064B5|nr:lipid phosphate phosphatase epsilon 2, chloroplastic [Diospyros lotus]